jgi:hypothetical protein
MPLGWTLLSARFVVPALALCFSAGAGIAWRGSRRYKLSLFKPEGRNLGFVTQGSASFTLG